MVQDDAAPAAMSPQGVLESCLYVASIDETERFYARVFSLETVTRREGRHVFMRCGDQMVLFFNAEATRRPPDPGEPFPVPSHGAEGAGHLCFAAGEGTTDAWRERLQTLGIPLEQEVVWPNGVRSLYLRDPSGNSIEIAERRLWFS